MDELKLPTERRKNKNVERLLLCPVCGQQRWGRRYRDGTLCRDCYLTKRRESRSPNWRGGCVRAMGGYIYVWNPQHPRCQKHGYVLRALLVAESAYGRPLKPNEIPHHINGITDDDRPENIKIMTAGQHVAFHNRQLRKAENMQKYRWPKVLLDVG